MGVVVVVVFHMLVASITRILVCGTVGVYPHCLQYYMTEELKMVLAVRDDLKMKPSEAAVQCSMATVELYELLHGVNNGMIGAWESHGQTKIAVRVPDETEM